MLRWEFPAPQPAKPAAGATAKPAVIVPVSGAKSAPAPASAVAKAQLATPAKKKTAKHSVISAKETAHLRLQPRPCLPLTSKSRPMSKRMPRPKSPKLQDTPKPEEKKWAMTGKRDPFFSPIVQEPSGSGCSTGKKCLEIGQINLRGVVKSENGFIAVVTNSLNKAYFLRENDPVFNGYVVRITGDTVVFQETVQDKLGKAMTREVTKRIFTPAV